MTHISTAALDLFLTRVRAAQRSRSKQFVMSIEEANDLAAVLGQLLLEKTELLGRINELLTSNDAVEIHMDGGDFK